MGFINDSNIATAAINSKRQTKLLRQLVAAQAQQAHQHQGVPAGWYPCETDPVGSVRYWDGQQWTAHFKP